MSVAKVFKITLFFPSDTRERVLGILHDMECVEAISGKVSDETRANEFASGKKRLEDVSRDVDSVRVAIDSIVRATVSLPTTALPAHSGAKVAITSADSKELLKTFDFKKICAEAAMLSKAISEAETSAMRYETEAARLEPWKDVMANLSELSDGSTVRFFAGQSAAPRAREFFKSLDDFPHLAAVVSDDGKTLSFGLAYPAAFADKMVASARKFGVTEVPYSSSDETPGGMLERVRSTRLAHIHRAARRREKLAGMYSYLPRLKVAHDILLKDKTLLESESMMLATLHVRYFTGWIVAKRAPEIEAALSSSGIPYHLVEEKPADGDDVPVVLENKKPFEPFEVVTDLYGKPAYTEGDPTPWVAPFFALFFGICMADAFYGLIIAAAGFAGIRYFKTPSVRKFMRLVIFCGAATTVFGALTGGYFGNLLDRFEIFSFARPLKNKLMIFDPLKNSIEFLAACLVLGFVQTMLGSVLKLVADLRDKNYREAFLSDASIIGIQISFPLLIIGELFGARTAPSSWLLAALGVSSAALMINQWIANDGIVLKLFQMFFSVYGAITGNALADILSYSRLFALGLSTALLAMVLNEVAALLFSSYIGIPFGIIVLLLFHPFILLIGSLGAYVHTSRLQYLEFFNKFFRGGGREMRPLIWIKKYTV
ncbi:MAG: hypothetical protein QME32_00565 [Endomicrobiia bacterium]|nr:hypothetical protein [Endomicrobiia bacterium]